MCKSSSCFAAVLAAICLPVGLILLSSEADAQPTVDELTSCGSSTLEQVVKEIDLLRVEIRDVKRLLNPADCDCECVTAQPASYVTAQPTPASTPVRE